MRREAIRVLRPRGNLASRSGRNTRNPGANCERCDRSSCRPECRRARRPSKFLYANKQECRKALERDGFHGESIIFETHLVEWDVPTPRYLFEAERDAGVRTAGLLAHQASTNSKRSCGRLKLVYDATQKAIGSPFQWPRTLSWHRNVERQIDFVGMKLEGRPQSLPLEEDDAKGRPT